MEPDFPARLLAEAHRHAPTQIERSRLMPLREALLTFRAKRTSYEKIAAILKGHGVTIQASTVGYFCRRYCPVADVERIRRNLIAAATGLPDTTARAVAAAATTNDSPGKRRSARIARDDL